MKAEDATAVDDQKIVFIIITLNQTEPRKKLLVNLT